jgi:hypothetical protein
MVCEACQLLSRKLRKLRKHLLKGTDSEPIEALDEVCALLQLSYVCDQDRDSEACISGHTCGKLGICDRHDAGVQVDFTQLEDSIIFESPTKARSDIQHDFDEVDTARSITVHGWMRDTSLANVVIPEMQLYEDAEAVFDVDKRDRDLPALINPLNLLHRFTGSVHEAAMRDVTSRISMVTEHRRPNAATSHHLSESRAEKPEPATKRNQNHNHHHAGGAQAEKCQGHHLNASTSGEHISAKDAAHHVDTEKSGPSPSNKNNNNSVSAAPSHFPPVSCDKEGSSERPCRSASALHCTEENSKISTASACTSGSVDKWRITDRIRQMISRGMCDAEIMAKIRRIPGGHKVHASRISTLRQTIVVLDGTIPEAWDQEQEQETSSPGGQLAPGKEKQSQQQSAGRNICVNPTYCVSAVAESSSPDGRGGSHNHGLDGFVSIFFQSKDDADESVRSAWDTERSEDRAGCARGADEQRDSPRKNGVIVHEWDDASKADIIW